MFHFEEYVPSFFFVPNGKQIYLRLSLLAQTQVCGVGP